MATCKGFKSDGMPCASTIVFDNGYCRWHQDQDVEIEFVIDEDADIREGSVENINIQYMEGHYVSDHHAPVRVVSVQRAHAEEVIDSPKKRTRTIRIDWDNSLIKFGITMTIAISACIFITGIFVGVFGGSADGGFIQDLLNVCMELLPILFAFNLLVTLYDITIILFLAIKGRSSKDHDDHGNLNQRRSLRIDN